MRERGELLSGNLVSWPVAPLNATGNWVTGELLSHQAHISPSCLHFLKICLCRDFQSFEKSQFLLVEWKKWELPHQTHISTLSLISADFSLDDFQSFKDISNIHFGPPWSPGGALGGQNLNLTLGGFFRTESKSSTNKICFYMSNEQHWTGIGSKFWNWYFITPLYLRCATHNHHVCTF